MHEGIKPFECKTAHKADLKRHLGNVHEGIKPSKT